MKLKSKGNVRYFIRGQPFKVKKGQVFEINDEDAKELLKKDKKHFEKIKGGK